MHAAVEAVLIALLFTTYRLGRLAARGDESAARGHARRVRGWESALGLPSESSIQQAVASVPDLFDAANRYYVYVHFPATLAFLVWAYTTRTRPEYRWARNLLVVQTFLALAVHFAFPLAPPRMFPEWGFTDTMSVYGPSAYEGPSATATNQFAAMPSLHIGWAVLIALVVARTASRRWTGLASAHALVTLFVVIVTANHWWADGIIAVGLLGAALVIFPRPGVVLRSRPG